MVGETLAADIYCYDKFVSSTHSCAMNVKEFFSKGEVHKVIDVLDSLDKSSASQVFFKSGLLHNNIKSDLKNGRKLDQSREEVIKRLDNFLELFENSNYLKNNQFGSVKTTRLEINALKSFAYGDTADIIQSLNDLSELKPHELQKIRGTDKALLYRIMESKDQELLTLYQRYSFIEPTLYDFIYDELNYGSVENLIFLKERGVSFEFGGQRGYSLFCSYLDEIIETQEEMPTKEDIESPIETIKRLTSFSERESFKCAKESLNEYMKGFNEMMVEIREMRINDSKAFEVEQPIKKWTPIELSQDELLLLENERLLLVKRRISSKCSMKKAQGLVNSWTYNYALRIFKKKVLKESTNFVFAEQRGSCLIILDFTSLSLLNSTTDALSLFDLNNQGWPL